MTRNKEFVCKMMGCSEARTGRKFASQGLSAHYNFQHGNPGEGSRQIKLQRKQLEKPKLKPNELTEMPAMQVETFDETGEVFPVTESHLPTGESLGEVDIRQVLEEHVGRIQGKLVDAQEQSLIAKSEVARLEDELKRAKAAQSAYNLEEKAKHAGSTNVDGGEYA